MYEVFLEMSKAFCGRKGGLFEDAKDYDDVDRILAVANSDGDKYVSFTIDAPGSATKTDGTKDVSTSSSHIPCVNNKGYFYAEIPTGDGVEFRHIIYAAGSNNDHDRTMLLPNNFGHDIVANARRDALKGNWYDCLTDVPTETELANHFRKSLI